MMDGLIELSSFNISYS